MTNNKNNKKRGGQNATAPAQEKKGGDIQAQLLYR
jgi:hypothetical protein